MKLINRILTGAGLSLLGGAAVSLPGDARADSAHHQAREIEVVVEGGYRPNRIQLTQGEHVKLTFIRKESSGCSREVVFPALGIRRELPEGVPVVIALPELEPGEYPFTCGMSMIRGTLVVQPRA